jgi:hypothetical protein
MGLTRNHKRNWANIGKGKHQFHNLTVGENWRTQKKPILQKSTNFSFKDKRKRVLLGVKLGNQAMILPVNENVGGNRRTEKKPTLPKSV